MAAGDIIGKVASIQGQAFIQAQDGSRRPSRSATSSMRAKSSSPPTTAASNWNSTTARRFSCAPTKPSRSTPPSSVPNCPEPRNAALLDRVGELADITRAIAEGSSLDQLLEETAAGLTGGGGNDGGHGFVQLLRIAEALDPAGYNYQFGAGGP
ncbi:MAG: retention module-containing protein, partial [Rhodocyclaceae bacterium]|nr:retention module-containing protein [Rhodocyclaceae bacterium]